MWLDASHFRMRLFLDFLRIVVLPCLVLVQVCQYFEMKLGLLSIPAYPISIVLWGCLRNTWYDIRQEIESKTLGAKPIKRVKGKWPGNVDVMLRMMKAFKTSYIMDVYLGLFQEYQCTTLNTRILWVDQIITMDEEHIKFVRATGFDNFWRGRRQRERMEEFLGDGIINRDGEMWKMHRSMSRPFFVKERISDFDLFEKHSQATFKLLSQAISSGLPCDVQDLYSRFTLDSGSEFLFGQGLNTLSLSLPEAGKAKMGPKGSATNDEYGSFAAAFETAQCVITQRARLGYFWPIAELRKNKMKEAADMTKKWVEPLVHRAMEEKEAAKKAGFEAPISDKTLIEHLANSTEDVSFIRDELITMLLAARDTTACLLTFVTYFMAIHPEVWQRMQEEVLQTHGHDQVPTYESLRSLKYLRAVLNETLRLFPPVPVNTRESLAAPVKLPASPLRAPIITTSENTLPLSSTTDARIPSIPSSNEPLYMPGSTPIMIMPMLMQRNPDLWGSDADAFDPDRWLDARAARYASNPMMFMPFSAGPRICLGQNFAYNEVSYFIVRLLQQFDGIELAPEYQPAGSTPPAEWKTKQGRQTIERIWPASALTMYVKGGLWVHLKKEQ